MICIKEWLIGTGTRSRGDEIAPWYGFEFIDRHKLMLGLVFILQILQKGYFLLCSVGFFAFRINIQSFVPHSKRLQLPERIEDMCRNEKHACHWSHFCVVFGQLLSSWLHSEEQVFLSLCLLLDLRSHHAIHVIEHVIVHCDNMMQCDCMPLQHPKGPQ